MNFCDVSICFASILLIYVDFCLLFLHLIHFFKETEWIYQNHGEKKCFKRDEKCSVSDNSVTNTLNSYLNYMPILQFTGKNKSRSLIGPIGRMSKSGVGPNKAAPIQYKIGFSYSKCLILTPTTAS